MRPNQFQRTLGITFTMLLCCSIQSWATQEHYSGESSGTSIQGTTILVKDGKIGTSMWNDIEQTLSVRNMILFEMDEEHPDIVPKSGTYRVDLTIEVWYEADVDSLTPSATHYDTLSFYYDTTSVNATQYRNLLPMTDAHQLRITIDAVHLPSGISGTPPSLRVYGELIIDRIYSFDCAQLVSIDTLPDTTVVKDLTISWSTLSTADEYDLEWTFYDSLSQAGYAIRDETGANLTDYNWLFKQNATRITTDQNSYKINLIYPDGYLFFRVRGVHYDSSGIRIYTQWSSVLSSAVAIHNFPDLIKVGWHDKDYNWQSQIVFAEEGKNVPSVNYFDGSLRQRQTVTLSNSDTTSIIQQTIYDHHGRAAVNLLPAPSFVPYIAYDSTFALNSSGNIYTKTDFDLGDCSAIPDSMHTSTGASRYFSTNNPQVSTGFARYLPDAQMHPFTVTEYTPDQSGRIRRQSGVGPTFKLGTFDRQDHDTKYFYGKPAQEELDRLFGNEVGNASHYFKNVVIDPNGQASVSYIDAHGRTIATALAGSSDSLTNVMTIDQDSISQVRGNVEPGSANMDSLTIDLLNNIRSTYELSTTHTLLVTENNVLHAFNYELDSSFYQPICVDSLICYDCIYDLNIKITDNCDGELFNETLGNYDPSIPLTFDTLCSVAATGIDTSFSLATLPIGEYKVTKTLTINQEALRFYADHFLTQANCLPDIDQLVDTFKADVDFSGCEISCETCLDDLGVQDTFINRIKTGILAANGTFTMQDSLDLVAQYAELAAACEDLCRQYDECEGLLEIMKADVSPGGQYAEFEFLPVSGDTTLNDTLTVIDHDTTSIFFYDGGAYAYQDSSINYTNAAGDPDTVWIDGMNKAPHELSPLELINHWNPAWADTLAKAFHPEYCYYEWCITNDSSNLFDQNLYKIENLDSAISSGFIDSTGQIDLSADPFFQTGGLGDSCIAKMDSLLNHINPYENDAPNLIDFVTEQIYGVSCETPFGQGTTSDNDNAWQLLRNLYLGYKDQLKKEKRAALGNCHPDIDCVGNPSGSCNSSPYRDKIRRVDNNFFQESDYTQEALEQQRDDNLQAIATNCIENCEVNVSYWTAQLGACTEMELDSLTRDTIMLRLRAVCETGCDPNHPNGASTTPKGGNGIAIPSTYGDTSFIQVLADYLGGELACEGCNAYLIDYPAPYDNPYQGPRTVRSKDACLCDNLAELESCYQADSLGYNSFSEYLLQFSNTPLSQAEIDTLKLYCTTKSDSRLLPQPMVIPPYLECGVCKTCDEITPLMTAFDAMCSDTAADYSARRAGYLNAQLGFTLLPEQYDDFIAKCDSNPLPMSCSRSLQLCPTTPYEKAEADTSCYTTLMNQVKVQALVAYQQILDSLREAFVNEYLAVCLDSPRESFTLATEYSEYQYTLYYYDQAGNLVKTIPPQGVVLNNGSTFLEEVEAYRQGEMGATFQRPAHVMPTTYVYNSLNQVVLEDTPDADSTAFWYDDLGRIVASQDGRQRELSGDNYYSYTKYDSLGRVAETGEIKIDTPMTNTIARDTALLADWFEDAFRGWITWTYYDEDPFAGAPSLGISGQENLRNRVAVQAIWNDGYANIQSGGITGESFTYYSYDIVGNVKTLVQDINFFEGNKRIDYEYDFLSGNVNAVYYQRGEWDQFTHRYHYDANNRLTEVYTSLVNTDEPLASPLWNRDASYQYYKHGPMARTVLGQHQVQGMDYAYTLQGWIKGVNSAVLDTDWDMGTDGEYTGTSTSYVARDAFGYTINYFDGDYSPIGGGGAAIELPHSSSSFGNLSASLYNGNIRHIVSQNKKLGGVMGYAYQYDQLHRLKQSRTRTLTDTTSYTWVSNTSGSTEFRTDYTYDLNGNLLSLDRGDAGGAGMDLLTYSYYGNNQTNLLNRVEDALSSGGGVTSGQAADNYEYDGSGNLVYNAQENIEVDWVHYDKPTFIYRDNLDGSFTGEVAGTYFEYDANQNRVEKKIESYTLTNGVSISDYRIQTTYYVRDAQGNVMATYEREETFNGSLELTGDTLQWSEIYLYGSARLGTLRPEISFGDTSLIPNSPIFIGDSTQLWLGRKRFEISNHLGNVTATISDRKQPVDIGTTGTADYYEPVILSATDYFPFGMDMPGRIFQAGGYRFGFNGKEKDDQEEWGDLTHYDYGFRVYNPGIGRFLSIDPLAPNYPELSPYPFAANSPIAGNDLDGLEYNPRIEANIIHNESKKIAEKTGGDRFEISRSLHDSYRKGSILGATGGFGIVGGGATAFTTGRSAYWYFTTNPEAAMGVGGILWGLGTDEDIPGFAGDDLGRAGRYLSKEWLDKALKKVNFDHSDEVLRQKSFYNCPSCVEAGDATLKNNAASALNEKIWKNPSFSKHLISQLPSSVAESFGRTFVYDNQTASSIAKFMEQLGHGSTGVVMGYKPGVFGEVSGHTFNVVNINGKVYFPDFQNGTYKSLGDVDKFSIRLMFFPTQSVKGENSLLGRVSKMWGQFIGSQKTITVEQLKQSGL